MIDFDTWWNSAAADTFRSQHDDMDGNEVRPVWDAALRAARAPEATQPTQAEAAGERVALELAQEALEWHAAGNSEESMPEITMDALKAIRAALATQQAVQGEPVAFEFYNPTTGHAIVDYSRQTHVGPLTKEMGYEARALGYINPPPAAVKPGDPVPLWQALEALDSLEESSRGDAPYNHFAAGLVRSALEQSATPPAPGQVERDSEDVIQLLDEVRQHFTRDDDLPDNLLSRIDAAIRAARSSEGGDALARGEKA